MNSVGLQVYNWRMRSGLSIGDAARSLDLSRQALTAIESGQRTPRAATRKRIESVIGPLEMPETKAETPVETEKKEEAASEYVPFTERLARSRGFEGMEDYMQRTRQIVSQREEEQPAPDAPETSAAIEDGRQLKAARLIGFMEGL